MISGIKIVRIPKRYSTTAKVPLKGRGEKTLFKRLLLKEQYLVNALAPNFDFWTECHEIKRCEESKRTLKNPFASRLAEFNTTLKLLRITDQ